MVLLIRSRSGQSTRDAYAIASSRLISKLDSVEARAVCRFGLTGDWEEVLNEAGGSILDTLGLALRWAPDGIVRSAHKAPGPCGAADARASMPCSAPAILALESKKRRDLR